MYPLFYNILSSTNNPLSSVTTTIKLSKSPPQKPRKRSSQRSSFDGVQSMIVPVYFLFQITRNTVTVDLQHKTTSKPDTRYRFCDSWGSFYRRLIWSYLACLYHHGRSWEKGMKEGLTLFWMSQFEIKPAMLVCRWCYEGEVSEKMPSNVFEKSMLLIEFRGSKLSWRRSPALTRQPRTQTRGMR